MHYLLIVGYVPGTVLGVRTIAENNKVFDLIVIICGAGDKQQTI